MDNIVEDKTYDRRKYQREYQRRRYRDDEEFRLKKKQALQKKIERIAVMMVEAMMLQAK